MEREHLGSRLGFILISAGCAIGCGNVWKFPWMTGAYGGGGFVLIYLLCLIILGLPVMTMEFSLGRAAQASPVRMYQNLEKPGQKWHIHGYAALFGNFCLMAFYTVVTGWMMYYFFKYLIGQNEGLSFVGMITDAKVNVLFLFIAVAIGFLILSFGIKSGLERVSKIVMVALFALLIVLAVRSITLDGAKEGLKFYLVPDLEKMNDPAHDGFLGLVVGAMNQAFFTLSLGIGSMAIFGSYIGKDRSLMGESVSIIALDTFVAIVAGLIIFPACFTYGLEPGQGPGLLFDTMATVFNNMAGGRWWGALFFLFMVFAALSTELSVFENILACVQELSQRRKAKKADADSDEALTEKADAPAGWSRRFTCLVCGVVLFLISLTTALGYSLWDGFQPFAPGSAWLDLWDFLVSTNLLPLGTVVIALFCTNGFGWGWDNFVAEANSGKGLKVKQWMKPIFRFVVPAIVVVLYVYGLVTFGWN